MSEVSDEVENLTIRRGEDTFPPSYLELTLEELEALEDGRITLAELCPYAFDG